MEVQLGELIEQIKRDGVAAAEAEARAIVEAARTEAARIVAEAETKAEKLLADAAAENARTVRSGEDAIRQAGRNLLLSFRESVARELRAVVEDGVLTAFSSAALSDLIVQTVAAHAAQNGSDDLAVILNEKDLAALEASVLSALKERLLTGVFLKPSDTFDGGFRIAVEGGRAYYDYSAEAVVEMLSAYLAPRVAALLKEAE